MRGIAISARCESARGKFPRCLPVFLLAALMRSPSGGCPDELVGDVCVDKQLVIERR
jgi:hypothetical protein